MKISELIKALEKAKMEHGDLAVGLRNDAEYGGAVEVTFVEARVNNRNVEAKYEYMDEESLGEVFIELI